MVHMVAWSPEGDKLAKWIQAFMSAVTTNWTIFKDKGPSGGCGKCMKGVYLITRVSYEISSYSDNKPQNQVGGASWEM